MTFSWSVSTGRIRRLERTSEGGGRPRVCVVEPGEVNMCNEGTSDRDAIESIESMYRGLYNFRVEV